MGARGTNSKTARPNRRAEGTIVNAVPHTAVHTTIGREWRQLPDCESAPHACAADPSISNLAILYSIASATESLAPPPRASPPRRHTPSPPSRHALLRAIECPGCPADLTDLANLLNLDLLDRGTATADFGRWLGGAELKAGGDQISEDESQLLCATARGGYSGPAGPAGESADPGGTAEMAASLANLETGNAEAEHRLGQLRFQCDRQRAEAEACRERAALLERGAVVNAAASEDGRVALRDRDRQLDRAMADGQAAAEALAKVTRRDGLGPCTGVGWGRGNMELRLLRRDFVKNALWSLSSGGFWSPPAPLLMICDLVRVNNGHASLPRCAPRCTPRRMPTTATTAPVGHASCRTAARHCRLGIGPKSRTPKRSQRTPRSRCVQRLFWSDGVTQLSEQTSRRGCIVQDLQGRAMLYYSKQSTNM